MRQRKTPRARSRFGRHKRLKGHTHSIWFVMLSLFANSLGAAQQLMGGTSADGMDPSEIVWMMVARNETGARELTYFTALRHYHLDFQGPRRTLTADMHVQVTYVAGSGKSFQVVDESGSRFLLNRVLRKLLTTEQADSRQQKGALTPTTTTSFLMRKQRKADNGFTSSLLNRKRRIGCSTVERSGSTRETMPLSESRRNRKKALPSGSRALRFVTRIRRLAGSGFHSPIEASRKRGWVAQLYSRLTTGPIDLSRRTNRLQKAVNKPSASSNRQCGKDPPQQRGVL
jgi:hypothetical protein